jgi:hypothetical protein
LGPRLVAEQASDVIVNPDDPDARVSVTFSAAVAVPPEFVSVNVFDAVPLLMVP